VAIHQPVRIGAIVNFKYEILSTAGTTGTVATYGTRDFARGLPRNIPADAAGISIAAASYANAIIHA
jgi:hypothetical protein